MRRLASLLLLPLLGAGCLPRAPEAAVRLEVSYTFKAGCIAVHARDPESQDREASDQVEVLQRGPSMVVLAVFRQEGWSHTLELTTTAHEQSCDGPEVARDVRTVKLQKKGGIERLALSLDAVDEDGDGYIAKAQGGTDCDDDDGNTWPGHSELCDGRDNDCNGDVDQGLTTTHWYPDRDGDGFGDREATPVESCAQPAHSVQNDTDCRDSDPDVYPRTNIS